MAAILSMGRWVKIWNNLGCLDQYTALNSKHTADEFPHHTQMEVNALLKYRQVPHPLEMCYQALMNKLPSESIEVSQT